ncbi:MAG: AEC family transporter [Bacteroides sp.]|nr:AEC family transporter [Bacteroides sp.]
MTDAFIFAANAVLPIVLMIALGYLLKRIGLLTPSFLDAGNKLTFRVLIPALLYFNIYGIGGFEEISFGFVLYGIAAVAVIFLIASAVTCLFTRDGGKRGALIQSAFRSNYAIIGLPLASALFGDKGAAAAGVMSAFCVPAFNILAVITLTIFNNSSEKGRIDVKKILIGIVKNPLIIGTALGLLTLGVRELFVSLDFGFRLKDIGFLYKTLENLKSICTPFALLVLGGKFEFSAVKRQLRYIVFGTLVRTVAVPVAALSAAYFFIPGLSGEHYAAYIGLFGTPVAVASAIMAKEMNADDELAGQLVVWTSLFSTATLFIYVAVFRAAGVF